MRRVWAAQRPSVEGKAIRPRSGCGGRRTLNSGGKYFGKSVPELVRYAHFRGLFAVITGFLTLRLICNRFYFFNLADQREPSG